MSSLDEEVPSYGVWKRRISDLVDSRKDCVTPRSSCSFKRKRKHSAEVRKRPELLQKFGDAWFKLQALYAKLGPISKRSAYVTVAPSKLLTMALHLVRHPEELKPSGERLEEFRESRLPALQRELLSSAPVYADLEERS